MQPQTQHTTEAVKLARTGVARSVDILIKIIDTHKIFLPIAKEPEEGKKGFVLHRLHNEESNEIVHVGFTEEQFLSNFGAKFNWTTVGGNGLKLIEVTIRDFLRNCLEQSESQKSSVVINPGHETQLDLTTDEVFKLLNSDNSALNRHLQRLPIQSGEDIVVSELTQETVTANVDVTIRSAVRKFSDFAKISYFAVSSDQRDKPVFLIKIEIKENIIYSDLFTSLKAVLDPILPQEFGAFNVRVN
jgi:hypothetical protein